MKSNSDLKKTSSQAPITYARSSYLAFYTKRQGYSRLGKKSVDIPLEVKIGDTETRQKERKTGNEGKELRFGDISSIVVKETESGDDESFCEIGKLLTSQVHKRDMRGFAKIGEKYGVKVPKTIIQSPTKTSKREIESRRMPTKPTNLRH
jgi:hypothetical protein